ncbi:MAG: outer membrane protein assembly factor BamB [Gammaproteobacteria bacterium]|nr:outer membrane protein assembly factor BamB [Gammaproteobacteria bacterium]
MNLNRAPLCSLLVVLLVAGCTQQVDSVKDTMGNMFKAKDEQSEALKKAAEPTPLDEEFKSSIAIKKVWSGRFGKGYEKLYLKLLPSWYGEHVYVADRDGRVMAVDVATGEKTWEERDKKRLISGGPGAGEGKVFVGTSEAQVVARDAKTGQKIWIAEVSSEVLAAPRAGGGVVLIRTGDGKLYALDAATGVQKWVFDRTIPTLTLRGSAAAVIHEDKVLAGFDNGRFSALELATGKELWETRLGEPKGRSDLERLIDVDSEPVILDNTAYIDCFQGRVAAVSLDNGSLEWTRQISSYEDLAVDTDHVYVTDEHSVVWALKRSDGATVWRQKGLKNRRATGPTLYGKEIVVGDFEGYLHWLDVTTGAIVGRERVDKERIITPPLNIGAALVGYSSSGEMSAWRVD